MERALLIDQVRLGATGLHVSRMCLGMMSYGNDSDRPWVLDEAAAEPITRTREILGATKLEHLEEGYVAHPVLGHE
jgi:hypothetical protein